MYKIDKLTIQIDSYCESNCSFCYLQKSKKQELKLTYNHFANFFKYFSVNEINLFGGDVLHNPKNIILLAKQLSCFPVKRISIPIEINKLERDYETILRLQELVKHPLFLYVSFHNYNCKEVKHNLVILDKLKKKGIKSSAVKILTKDEIKNLQICKLTSLSKALDKLNLSLTLKTDYSLINDYEQISVEVYNQFFSKLVSLLSRNVVFSVYNGTCAVNAKEYFLLGIDNSGILYDCLAVNGKKGLREHDINVLTLNKDIAKFVYKEIKTNKSTKYTSDINRICSKCVAKDACSKCVKMIDRDIFDGSSVHCSLYRHVKEESLLKKVQEYKKSKEKKKKASLYNAFAMIIDYLTNSIVYIDKEGEEYRKNKCRTCDKRKGLFCLQDYRLIKYKYYKDICPLNKWKKDNK